MPDDGELIYYTRDPYGELKVLDNGHRRTLSFGPGDEQSACLKADPALLLFDYTQVMLLALLFRPFRKVLCLGLGAGSLVTALQRHCKGTKITVVELRQAVIDIALNYFYLPSSKRVQLHCGDAEDFVVQASERYDLIFSDLYTSQGLSPLQLKPSFLSSCAERLKPDGLLVINCWREHQHAEAGLLQSLEGLFTDIRLCPTADGNWVIFASRSLLEPNPNALREAARQWSQTLGFSLLKHLKNLNIH